MLKCTLYKSLKDTKLKKSLQHVTDRIRSETCWSDFL